MARGMTGFGRASREGEAGSVAVEVKSVNNRFLKIATRLPDLLGELETEVEKLIRAELVRGSVYCQVKLGRSAGDSHWRLNEPLLRQWFVRLQGMAGELGCDAPGLGEIARMQGVVEEVVETQESHEELFAMAREAVAEAVAKLAGMRGLEGETLTRDLEARALRVGELAEQVETRAPVVVREYREKLKARIENLLKDTGVAVEDAVLVRETAFFADRCDITEEITRLRHHCEQFVKSLHQNDAVGRKLDFIAQEMLRETNTIGSKASDPAVATLVVEMKSEVEKIKEQVQNLE